MKLKTAMLLCLIIVAATATVATGLAASMLDLKESYEKTILDGDPLPPGPLSGDPIGGGGGPH